MIKYNGMIHLICQMEGSIIPFAVCVALPCAVLSALVKLLQVHEIAGCHILLDVFKIKGSAYGSFSSLLGFLVVFRTSQAYTRYWIGGGLLQQMVGSWFDAASSLSAFCRMSKATKLDVKRFLHLVTRLFSLLSALALVELEGTDEGESEGFFKRLDQLEIIDGQSLDSSTLGAIKRAELKMELVFNWIEVAIVEAIDKGILNIPPPILTRAFMELADGMAKYHDCMKIAILPFPFPYSQATLILLILHWCITPLMMCTWTENAGMAALFSFLIIFIFWGLYAIATELENPFGDDPNDLDAVEVQRDLNAKLLLLISSDVTALLPGLDPSLTSEDLDWSTSTRVSTLRSVWDGHRRTNRFTNIGSSARRDEPRRMSGESKSLLADGGALPLSPRSPRQVEENI
mmetsp:Transcript_55357/g.161574  ORF Transcript_55357/g.161574 Transcript_55357/m.161574 type:complete len:403 (+) Transcript_55357:126-1334(+)